MRGMWSSKLICFRDSNGIRTHNHLVHKRTFNHLSVNQITFVFSIIRIRSVDSLLNQDSRSKIKVEQILLFPAAIIDSFLVKRNTIRYNFLEPYNVSV